MQKNSYNMIRYFKKLLVIFWTLWWLTALWTDIIGAFAYLNWLNASWAPSKNYPFLIDSLKMYALYDWIPPLLFTAIIAWLVVVSIMFCRSSYHIIRRRNYLASANTAFAVSLSLWFAFLLADQMIMNYDLEANHMVQASMQLLCWLYILLTPEKKVGQADDTKAQPLRY